MEPNSPLLNIGINQESIHHCETSIRKREESSPQHANSNCKIKILFLARNTIQIYNIQIFWDPLLFLLVKIYIAIYIAPRLHYCKDEA